MNINNTFADINNRLSLVENNQKELNQYILSLQNEIEFLKSQIVSMNETFNNTFTLLLNQTTKVNIKKKIMILVVIQIVVLVVIQIVLDIILIIILEI